MADTEVQQTTADETPVLEQTTEPTPAVDETLAQETTEEAQKPDENGGAQNDKQEEKTAEDEDEESDEDKRKLFVGGLSWMTTNSSLKDFMTQFGEIEKCTLKMDSKTGKSRGFGFVIFKEIDGLTKALANVPHKLDDRTIDSRKAQPQRREGKLFVGGVKPETTEEQIKEYFSKFGKIDKFERPFDQRSQKSKPFCFITFSKDGPIAKITVDKYHDLDGKQVECKQAEPPSGGYGNARGGRNRNAGGMMDGGWNGGFNNFGPGSFNQGYGPGYGGGFGPYGGGGFGDGYGGGYGNYNQGYGFGPGYGFGGGGGGGGFGYGGGNQSGFGKAGRNRQGNNFKPY